MTATVNELLMDTNLGKSATGWYHTWPVHNRARMQNCGALPRTVPTFIDIDSILAGLYSCSPAGMTVFLVPGTDRGLNMATLKALSIARPM